MKTIKSSNGWLIVGVLSGLASSPAPAQVIYSGAGLNAAGILVPLNNFQSDLGTLNPNVAGSFGSGRREINWDGVPDSFSAPNNLPANFFNSTSPRGVIFNTPGTGFQVSADSSPGSTPVQFGDIDANYPSFFEPFSAERLFTAVGSNILDVNFFVPGSSTPALSRGFGSVFSDVDLANTTSLEFFDAANISLGTFFAPNSPRANETFSFLGVSFPTPIVSRVRITSGNQVLAPGNTFTDLVVMDDFVYGEPTVASVPEAGNSIILLTLSLLGLFAVQRLTRGAKVG